MTIDHESATNRILLNLEETKNDADVLLGFCCALKNLRFITNYWHGFAHRRGPYYPDDDGYQGAIILINARRPPDGD